MREYLNFPDIRVELKREEAFTRSFHLKLKVMRGKPLQDKNGWKRHLLITIVKKKNVCKKTSATNSRITQKEQCHRRKM
jgi:hypothetical protein